MATFEVVDVDQVSTKTDHQTQHDREVADLLDELAGIGASASIRIFRCRPGSKNADEFIDAFPADKYDLPGLYHHLRHNYGGGDYRIMMFKPGHKGVYENKLLSLAHTAAPVASVPATTGAGDLGAIVNGMMQGMALMMENSNRQFSQLMETLRTPAKDPYEEQKKMLELAKMQREAFGIGTNAAPAAPVAPVDPFDQMSKMLAGLVALKSAFSGAGLLGDAVGGGEDDSILGVAKALGPQILGAITNQQKIEAAKVTATAAAQIPARRPNPAPRAPSAPATGAILPPEALAVLIKAAADDLDPADVAAQAVTFLTPEIKAVAMRRDAFKCFAKAHPEILDAPDWWLDLLMTLQELIAPVTLDKTENKGAENGNAGQDVTNRGGNGGNV